MSSFPYKLHQLLTDIENNEELSSIISWLPSGNGFRIHMPAVFQTVLLKKYFPRQSKLKSFKRQVQYYCFENLGRGSYSHPCFVRGKRSLCGKIIHKLPMKNLAKTTNKSSKVTTSKVVSRSSSPSAMTLTKTNGPITENAPSMSVFKSNNLPLLNPQSFVMSTPTITPTKPNQLVVPKAQNLERPVFPVFPHSTATFAGPANPMQYMGQFKEQQNVAFPNCTPFGGGNMNFNGMAPNSFQQQAMQEYMKLLLTR